MARHMTGEMFDRSGIHIVTGNSFISDDGTLVMSMGAAPLCLSIRIVSGAVVLLAVLLFAASLYEAALLPIVAILGFSVALAYGLSPSEYAIENGSFVVRRRWGAKTCANVVRCSIPEERPRSFTLRLWGNGGLFSGTGIFRDRRWGLFRAYVTRSKHNELVLVETATMKILISPGTRLPSCGRRARGDAEAFAVPMSAVRRIQKRNTITV